MRELATVQRINKLEAIEGKDRIELATIKGWKVIVGKGDFKIGDLVIYCEVDSLLPEKPEFEFLRKRCFLPKWNGHRIRAMKMAGVVSYGIVFPEDIISVKYKEGKDVTELIGVRKYDPELLIEQRGNKKKINPIIKFLLRFKIFGFLRKRKHRDFPTHLISKTDEERVQNIPAVLKEFKGTNCYITEKLDGQSGTFVYNKKKFYVCSRNLIVTNKNSNYWKIAEKYNIEEKLKSYPENIAIQGEIVGSGIQKNKYNIEGKDFFVFNVWFISRQRYMSLSELLNFCGNEGFMMVPILDDSFVLQHTVDQLLELSKGRSILQDTLREGIVIRDRTNIKRDIRGVGQTLSFKAVNPDFLIKHGE